MGKRLWSVLLALAMALILAPVLGGEAKAATNWATEVWVAGSSEDNGSGATQLSLSNIGQQIHYTRNDGVQQAAWLEQTDGKTILCLSDYQVHSNAGRFYNNSTALAGIYCEGDLEIQVYGDCAFRAKNFSRTHCYGIYVLGNLTIVNRTTYDGSLTLEMGESATTTGEGIRCDTGGTLTLKTQNNRSLTVRALGCPAQYSRGVFARTMVMNGGKLIAQGRSQGVYVTERNNSVSVPTCYAGASFDGSDKQLQRDVSFVNYKYSELDADTVGVEMAGWTYGGTANDLVYTSYVTGGTPTVRYSGTTFSGASYSSTTRPTKAGSYRVTVSYTHPRSVQGSAAFTIAKKSVSVSNIQIKNKEYDGNTSATVQSAGTLSGVKSGDTVSVTSGTATFANKNVGTNKTVTCTGWALTGADKDNYTLSAQPTAKASITAKPVTVTGVTAVSRAYEPGNTAVSLTGGAVYGKVGSDNVSVNLTNAVGTMADDDAGTSKPVTVTGAALVGTDAGNYTLSAQPVGVTVTISKAANPIKASPATVTAGGALDLSSAISGAQGSVIFGITGESLGCSVSGSTFTAGNTAGTVTVTAVATGNSNYESGTAAITVTIGAMQKPTVTVSGTKLHWSAQLPDTGRSVTAIAAWYDANGRMLGITSETVTANGAASGDLTVAAGAARYKLMLVDGTTYAPRCPAWDSKEAT